MPDRVDCVAVAKKFSHEYHKKRTAAKGLLRAIILAIVLYIIGILVLILLKQTKYTFIFNIVLFAITGFFVIKHLRAGFSVNITPKQSLLYQICKLYSLLSQYRNKQGSDSTEINETIERMKNLRANLGSDLSFTGKSGYDFSDNFFNFLKLLRKSIKVFFLPKIEKVEDIDKILYALQEIVNRIQSEKFDDSAIYFESLGVKLDKGNSLRDIWERFNKFKLRDTSISLIICILVLSLYWWISNKYDLFTKLSMSIWVTLLIALTAGTYKLSELYVPVLVETINLRFKKSNLKFE